MDINLQGQLFCTLGLATGVDKTANMAHNPVPLPWRLMKLANQRLAQNVFGAGKGPANLVLLLTTVGRKSGLSRVTPLQYEEVGGAFYVAAGRGQAADWFRNILANPNVTVQIRDKQFEALAEPVTAPCRIADFLELRLRRHPVMFRLMLLSEGLILINRTALERFAQEKALVIIHPKP